RRPRATHGAREQEDFLEERQVEIDPLPISKGKSGCDEGAFNSLPGGHTDPGAIAKRASAPRRRVELAAQWIPDDARHDALTFAGGDRDAPEGKSGDEVGSSVERIDDPSPSGARLARSAPFLTEKPVPWKPLTDRRDNPVFALPIRGGHEVILLLLRHGAARELPPVGEQDLAARSRRRDSHSDELFAAHWPRPPRASRAKASAIVRSAGVPSRL